MLINDDPNAPNVLMLVDALRVLRRCLRSGEPVPPDVGKMIGPGIELCLQALDDGKPASLDRALGLKRHGGVTLRQAMANAERDRLIQHLVRVHQVWSCRPVALVAKEMTREFDRYKASRWKRDCYSSMPAAEPQSTFWKLLRAGCDLPSSERLRKILSLVIQDPL